MRLDVGNRTTGWDESLFQRQAAQTAVTKLNTGSAGTKQDPNRTQAMPPPVCMGTRGAALGSKHGGECGLGRDKPRDDQRSVYSSNKNI